MNGHRAILGALVLLLLGPASAPASAQVRTWTVGEGGVDWPSQSGTAAAADLRLPGSVQPIGFSAGENIVAALSWLDGAPADFTREGGARVWDNAAISASDLAMVDGDPATSTEARFKGPGIDQTGRILYFDLGASFPADGLAFYPGPAGNQDFLRAFEISVSDGRHFGEQQQPVYQVLRRVDINTDPRVSLDFPLQLLRFIRLRVTAPNPFEIAELEVRGQGFVPRASYLSRFIDFGAPVNLGRLRVETEPVGQGPASVTLTVRNGADQTPLVYHRIDFETQVETEVTAEQHADLPALERGPVRYDADNWSSWTRPLVVSAGGQTELDLGDLPGPRRFVQFALTFEGSAAAVMRVKRLAIDHTAPLARRAVAEVARRDEPVPLGGAAAAPTGRRAEFVCGVQAEFSAAGERGFDGVQLSTPEVPEFLGLWLGGAPVTPDSVRIETGVLSVFFPANRVTASANRSVKVAFAATPLLYQTLFGVWLLDTGGPLPQSVAAGDAGPDIGTSSLAVFGTLGSPLGRLVLSAGALSPNGDGTNDQIGISFDLLFLIEPAPVELTVHALSGRRVRRLLTQELAAGNHRVTWDGLDGAGGLVPPGTYLCRLEVQTQAGRLVEVAPVTVVY